MISVLIYDPDENEMASIIRSFRDELAYLSDEDNRFLTCHTITELESVITSNDIGNLCVISFDEVNGQEIVGRVRNKFPGITLMLCVDDTLSPKAYIRPGILASSVLFRPFTGEDPNGTIKEFISNYFNDTCEKKDDDLFKIESKDGIIRVPYEQINYFEASSKRIFVRLQREDYGYYDTLEHLEGQLPSFFIRCHRSYIVNLHRIRKYNTTEYVVELESGVRVPVSRKYREIIQESIK